MRCLIYTRVMPDNNRVAKSDQLSAQQKRCREFANKLNSYVHRVFSDQGEMKPPYFLPGINSLVSYIKSSGGDFLVIADHPARLGVKEAVRKMVLKSIEEAGGKFISVHNAPADYLEMISNMILAEAIHGMERELKNEKNKL